MSYEPKTWETGEVITASDLNHMENAIGAFYVTVTEVDDVSTLSASYNDILSAFNAGKNIVLIITTTYDTNMYETEVFTLTGIGKNDRVGYYVKFGPAYGATSDDADSNMAFDNGES